MNEDRLSIKIAIFAFISDEKNKKQTKNKKQLVKDLQLLCIAVHLLYSSFSLLLLLLFCSLQLHSPPTHSQKKRYKSCHWGGTFSKHTLFYILHTNMYTFGSDIYLQGTNIDPQMYTF